MDRGEIDRAIAELDAEQRSLREMASVELTLASITTAMAATCLLVYVLNGHPLWVPVTSVVIGAVCIFVACTTWAEWYKTRVDIGRADVELTALERRLVLEAARVRERAS